MKIEVHAERLHQHDPALTIYHVELEDGGTIWRETFGSAHELRLWLRGVRAGWSMSGRGFLRLPDLPREGETRVEDTSLGALGSYRVT